MTDVSGHPDLGMVRVVGLDPARSELLLEHDDVPGFRFGLTFVDGELDQVRVVRDSSSDVRRWLTRTMLKAVPLGELERAARRHLRWFNAGYLPGRSPDLVAAEAELKKMNAAFDRTGRPEFQVDPYQGSPTIARMLDGLEDEKRPVRRRTRGDAWYATL